MKVVLVNPPRSSYDLSELGPPLGLLRLGAVARNCGADISLLDFNLLWHQQIELRENFYEKASEILIAHDGDLYGFTSMAVDSHVAIKLASLVKAKRPDCITVFGGTHFSAISQELLQLYQWIDFVIEGEGESAFQLLVERTQAGESVPTDGSAGVLSRNGGAGGNGKLKPFAAELPQPDYSLVNLDEYFSINPNRVLDVEGGRGCRFKCSFCYSPSHYRGAREFASEQRIENLRRVVNLGAKHAFFVEDNFLNNPQNAIEFCRTLEAERLNVTWHCYVTWPQLSSELITWMARAGCTSVFAGIDAVGATSQKVFHKNFTRSSLHRKIEECVDTGIMPTCAFLISPPSHACGVNIQETLMAALRARVSGAMVRLNTLTLYNRTTVQCGSLHPIESDNLKARLLLDAPEPVEENEFAADAPQLFPFHSRYVRQEEWKPFLQMAHCLFTLFYCYPQTLNHLWDEEGISPVKIADDVLNDVGDLLAISKRFRRDEELFSASRALKSIMASGKALKVFELEEAGLR